MVPRASGRPETSSPAIQDAGISAATARSINARVQGRSGRKTPSRSLGIPAPRRDREPAHDHGTFKARASVGARAGRRRTDTPRLGVLHTADGAAVLALHADRVHCVRHGAGLVDQQDLRWAAERVDVLVAQIISHPRRRPSWRVAGDAAARQEWSPPRCSALVQHFGRRYQRPAKARAYRHAQRSHRAKRGAIRAIMRRDSGHHRSGSTLRTAATAADSGVCTYPERCRGPRPDQRNSDRGGRMREER